MNLYIRVICLLCASLMATHAFAQDLSGWSDKTVCRLTTSQQDDPQYLQEAKNRGLSCGSEVAKKTNNIRKSILSFSEIAAENKRLPKQPKDLCCAGIAVGNFSEKPGLELFAVKSPKAYETYLWGQGKPPHTLSKSYLDAGMKKANDLNWVDKMSFRDGNNKRLSLKIEGKEQFCLHSSATVPADFNGDGIDDILVACSGYDAKPYPGDHSYVILSQKSKAFEVVRITTKKGFYHGATVFDVNNDGYIDALLTDSNTGKVTVYLNDGDGQFSKPKTVLSNLKWNYTISSYDFNNDGAVDFILGGHEYDGNRNGLTTKIYLGDGNGKFSSNRDYHIPKLRNFSTVLDYLVHRNFLFVLRTSGGYDGGAIQQIDLNTMKQVNVLSKTNVRHLRRLQRVYNSGDESADSATFGTLDQYSKEFDFQINTDGNINFVR
ncbi:VCBS repeat-containing protein [Oceanospirillaceae bacterium]|nr:VCBS repeat-containing protein [Oceanospirillaceae bacterium]